MASRQPTSYHTHYGGITNSNVSLEAVEELLLIPNYFKSFTFLGYENTDVNRRILTTLFLEHRLTSLSLESAYDVNDALKVLSSIPVHRSCLRYFSILNNILWSTMLTEFPTNVFKNVTSLRLNDLSIDDDKALRGLCTVIAESTSIGTLDLSGWEWNDGKEADLFFPAMQANRSIHTLNMERCCLKDSVVDMFVPLISGKKRPLKKLYLSNNSFNHKGSSLILANGLTDLVLFSNTLSIDACVGMLMALPLNSTLQTVILSSNCNTYRAVYPFESFSFSPALTYLAILGIVLYPSEFAIILESLHNNTTLNFLQIDNKIVPEFYVNLPRLTLLVEKNRSLCEIKLKGFEFGMNPYDETDFMAALNLNPMIEDILVGKLAKSNRPFKKETKRITRRNWENRHLKTKTLAAQSFEQFHAAIKARCAKVR